MSQSDPKPYTKSLQDELNWKLLDQLHAAVVQISSFCFEIKKFCITTLFVVLTFLVKFTSEKLDHSIFLAGLLITICFWFLDATAYFYQVKLRGVMEGICKKLKSHGENLQVPKEDIAVIDPSRTSASFFCQVVRAGFNHSMWLYALLLIINSVVWLLYYMGGIK